MESKEIKIIIPIWETEMKIVDKIDKKIIKLLINSAINSTLEFCNKTSDIYNSVKCCYIIRPTDS